MKLELRFSDSGNLNVKLFAELAAGGLEVGLAGFALAAGEFPEAAVPLVVGALADEHTVIDVDDGGGYAD